MWFRKNTADDSQWAEMNRNVMNLTKELSLSQALALGKKLLEYSKKNYGGKHIFTVTALNNLGIIHTLSKEFDEAESYLLSALQISEEINGTISSEVAIVNENLGRLYTMKSKAIKESLEKGCLHSLTA